MFKEEIQTLSNTAKAKALILQKKPFAYFILSMLAGMYIGVGILLIFSIGGYLSAADSPATKIVMGASFGIALSLVVMAGAELFTGNNLIISVGFMTKSVTWRETIKLWSVCWLGNLAGSVLLAVLFSKSGLAAGDVGEFMAKTTEAKMAVPGLPLFIRGILCNFLVCLGVWCGVKLKSESGKLIMIFWCLFAFIAIGFEHSVANMTLLAVGLLNPMDYAISTGGYFYNLGIVTLGNMLGGIVFVAVPYVLAAKEK